MDDEAIPVPATAELRRPWRGGNAMLRPVRDIVFLCVLCLLPVRAYIYTLPCVITVIPTVL